jgi:hypothetical protein
MRNEMNRNQRPEKEKADKVGFQGTRIPENSVSI